MDGDIIEAVALSIRTLTMDAVQKANSGHPGLPMGLAELGALVYGELLKHHPAEPMWIDRDRFVLSAGHGCMLLYSLLHMCGYGLPLEEIKRFRQIGSKTPGHPERGLTPGVETTTGPLGQGFGNAVGMAIAEAMLAARFNTDDHRIIDHYTYVIAGDGDMMEGVTSEAASLAGHLGLGKLIVFYDSNRITIEGSTELAFSEDVAGRFEAYRWHVQKADAYDIDSIRRMVQAAKEEKERPNLILVESIIAKGSPHKAGSHEAHGAPLGEDEVRASKKHLGVSEESSFYVDPKAAAYFEARIPQWKDRFEAWRSLFDKWSRANPSLRKEWDRFFGSIELDDKEIVRFEVGEKIATRSAGGKIINGLVDRVPNLVGGAADLAPSTKTLMTGEEDLRKGHFKGKNFHFGVREHAMGAITNGVVLHGGFRPFCSTFFVFTDYMRPPIRLAAIMKLPVIYVFTHDSIFVGEDGPTHQPVEHLAALRAIPGLVVLRPADAQETEAAWRIALLRDEGPTALALTRQNLEVFEKHDSDWRNTIQRGAYVVKEAEKDPELVVIATGSEVGLALRACDGAAGVRVVSMMSRALFMAQPKSYREKLLPPAARHLVVEAGVSFGWGGVAGSNGTIVSLDRFGESGPYADVAAHLGFDASTLKEKVSRILSHKG
jgi:transketolase